MGHDLTAAGIAAHNGWAILVCVSVRKKQPVIVDRRRLTLIEPGLPNLPYEHDTAGLDVARAEELVAEVQESAIHCAGRELERLRSSQEIAAIALREPLLPRWPLSIAEVRASSHITVRADPMIYHHGLCTAAAALGIAVEQIPRGQERYFAAQALQLEPDRLDRWLTELRATLGAPWQKDHQEATARSIVALGRRARISFQV